MKKNSCIIILSSLFINNVFAEWVNVTSNHLGDGYIDVTTIKKSRGYVLGWSLVDFSTCETNRGRNSGRVRLICSISAYQQFDCELGRVKELGMYIHDGKMGSGEKAEYTIYKPEWTYPIANSSADEVMNYVCRK